MIDQGFQLRADRRIVRSFNPDSVNPPFINRNPQHSADQRLLRDPCRGEDQPAFARVIGDAIGQAAQFGLVKAAPGEGFDHRGKIAARQCLQPVNHDRSDIEAGSFRPGYRHVEHRLIFNPHRFVDGSERAVPLGLLHRICPVERILRRQSLTSAQE